VIGTHVSHYRILSQIGRGGMGEVYLAEDLSLNRSVALKFLLAADVEDETARRRLAREGQAAARLDHPFICKIYEVDSSGAHPFIAMEYVEGVTLRHELGAGRIAVPRAIRIASELAEALDLAHERGIVHRDLKPSNVMLTRDGHVKVMDFGLAKQIAALVGELATISRTTGTQTGDLVGTLAYMSPEQLHGLPVDARSDVFAFGLILHEMVSGSHPFRRSSPIAVTDAILNAPEPPLDEHTTSTTPLLAHVVSRCLAKNRDERYQSMRDVRIELNTIAGDSASLSRRTIPAGRRFPRWPAVAAVVIVAALGASAIWRWPIALPLSQRSLAFQERDWIVATDFENLTGDAVFDRSLRAAVEVGLAQSRFVNVFSAGRVQDALQRMRRPGIDRIDEALASEIAVREGARAVLACSIAQVGDVYSITARLIDPRARTTVLTESVQAKGRNGVLPALDALTTRVRRSLGESLAAVSRESVPLPKATTASLDALKMYADSMRARPGDAPDAGGDLLRQAVALDPDFALAHAELGRRYYLAANSEVRAEAERHFVTALALLDRLGMRERLWIRAIAEDSRGNRRQAVDAYQSYLAQYPDDARAWFRMGWTQMAGLGQAEQAIPAFKRSLELYPNDAGAHINLATCLSALGRRREAVDEYRKAFALDPQSITGDFVNSEYGFTLVHLGDLDAAAETFQKMTAEPGKKARGLRSLALLDMYRGQYAAAIGRLREAILINRTAGARVSEFRDRLFLVRALAARGLTAESRSELAAVDSMTASISLGPEWLAMVARIHARGGQVSPARRLLEIMTKSAADATAGSSANRNSASDERYLDLVRGEIALAEHRPSDAVALFEAARAGEPRETDAVEALAAAYAAGGRAAEAVARYEELIAQRPFGTETQEDWLIAHVRLGELYERTGRPDAARQRYEDLLALWKDGDPDIVTRHEAAARLARLPKK